MYTTDYECMHPIIKAYYKITTYINGYVLVPKPYSQLFKVLHTLKRLRGGEPGDEAKWIGTAAVCRIRPLQGNSKGGLIALIYGLHTYMYMQSSHSYAE